MKALSKLYTANVDNKVVLFGTNLKEFSLKLIELEPSAEPYHTLRRKFEKQDYIDFVGKSGKRYVLQEVYNVSKIKD